MAMSTRRPPISLEGTLEVIDLSHASDEEAAMAVLREIKARRNRRPRAANGPALVIELDRLNGASDGPPRDPGAGYRSAPRHAGGGDTSRGERRTVPFSLADLGEVLRRMSGAPGDAPEEQESTPGSAPATERV